MFRAGIALLLADKLNEDNSKRAIWAVLAVDCSFTIPLSSPAHL